MTINERVRYLRKEILSMNQTEFAKQLGMKQTGISYMERNGSTVTNKAIKTICLVFNVNEDWLINGNGSVLAKQKNFNLNDFILKHGATTLELEAIKAYFEIEPSIRRAALEYFKNKLSAHADMGDETLINAIPNTPEELENKFPPILSDSEDDKNKIG